MYYLAIQNTYDEVQCALMDGISTITTASISKLNASKTIINRINDLLQSGHVSLSDLTFIVANCGPGPFTTLRVVITTVNGIAYARYLPLVGINALYAAATEWHDPSYKTTAFLFNAFGNDLYTLVLHNNKTELYGVYAIDTLLEKLKTITGTIQFLGNGTALHRHRIARLGNASIPDEIPLYPSLKTIATIGYNQWSKHEYTNELLQPIYLKHHPATQS